MSDSNEPQTKEAVALALLKMISAVEQNDKKEILDLYKECLRAVNAIDEN